MARRILQGVRACQFFLNASEQVAVIVELRADFPCAQIVKTHIFRNLIWDLAASPPVSIVRPRLLAQVTHGFRMFL